MFPCVKYPRRVLDFLFRFRRKIMGEVTHEQVNLMLRLYDIRREPRLREARDWFMNNFRPTSPEDVMRQYPPASQENAYFRMVMSYWEMAASIVNRRLIDEELFFENTGEQWIVWERLKPMVPAWRALFKNPHMLSNLEDHCMRLEAWREKRAPGTTQAMRDMFAQMEKAAAAAKK
jgi:hypothetical protein